MNPTVLSRFHRPRTTVVHLGSKQKKPQISATGIDVINLTLMSGALLRYRSQHSFSPSNGLPPFREAWPWHATTQGSGFIYLRPTNTSEPKGGRRSMEAVNRYLTTTLLAVAALAATSCHDGMHGWPVTLLFFDLLCFAFAAGEESLSPVPACNA
jgi:hypothetical protein